MKLHAESPVLHAETSCILHAKELLLYFTWPFIVTLLRLYGGGRHIWGKFLSHWHNISNKFNFPMLNPHWIVCKMQPSILKFPTESNPPYHELLLNDNHMKQNTILKWHTHVIKLSLHRSSKYIHTFSGQVVTSSASASIYMMSVILWFKYSRTKRNRWNGRL